VLKHKDFPFIGFQDHPVWVSVAPMEFPPQLLTVTQLEDHKLMVEPERVNLLFLRLLLTLTGFLLPTLTGVRARLLSETPPILLARAYLYNPNW